MVERSRLQVCYTGSIDASTVRKCIYGGRTGMAVSDRSRLEDLSQSLEFQSADHRKSEILNGEMSEWLKALAWKADPGESHRAIPKTSSRNQLDQFPRQHTSRCNPVSADVCRPFQGHLTQFLHSSERHFLAYAVMFLGACRGTIGSRLVSP